MAWKFGKKSLERLAGIKEPLQTLAKAAITDSPYDFSITNGLRTLEEQKVLFATGKSKTMKSKHLTGNAFDIAVFVDGKLTWDLKYYKVVATHIKKVAAKLGIKIVWGGDWKSFIDGPHFELSK
jgi:peptidoglycan L-alanyl-D-glutamate endopeptidase CwlK